MLKCKNCQKFFTIHQADTDFYQKIQVPNPTWCPSCRHLRRHGSINDYVFYTRTCDHCKKIFVSVFPPKSEYKVFCQTCWYTEDRNDKAQGRDYDFSRSFFEQFDELMHATPQLGIIGMNNENCDFCESVAHCKNCYLISESSNCEDCFYSYWIQKSRDCLDCMYLHECERCYEAVYCFNCYNLKYSQNCFQCSDSYFLDNCTGCQNCLFSTNLRHKQYYIWNKSYSKQDYFVQLERFDFGNFDQLELYKKKFQQFVQTQPQRNFQTENVENCTGDYIRNAKNCQQVFHCYDAEECSYGEHIWRGAKYCMDSNTAGRNAELLYETTNSGLDSYNVKFSRYCWGCRDTEYSIECKNGSYLFGCVSLKPGARYCILNKPYEPEVYQKIVKKIKEKMLVDHEYGEFFPLSMALFGYNNSVSFDEFPCTREEALSHGWKWEDQRNGTRDKGTVDMKKISGEIQDAPDAIVNEILSCEKCQRNYKIIPQEFNFYKKERVPLPHRYPDCRHRERFGYKNGKVLQQTSCANCHKSVQTTLNPQKYFNILCESCYKRFLY